MNFPLNAYLAALAGAFVLSLGSLPLWRRISQRAGLVDDPGPRKIHAAPVPLAGGLTILTGIIVPLLFASMALHWKFLLPHLDEQVVSHGLKPGNRTFEISTILLAASGMFIIGLLDDKFELRPMIKFGGQFAIAVLTAAAHVRITLFVHNALFSYAVTVLWILTVTNAFNFMDNMNGLCAGLGAIGSGYFALIAALDGQLLVAVLALLTAGSLLGFLPWNFPRAKAFLGDAGSHLVGYLLAVMAVLPHFYTLRHPRVWAVFTPLLILAVPLGDLACVVLIRWRLGKPFYIGDNNHLSHRLVKRGLTNRNAVLLIWLLAALLGGVALFLAL